MKKEVKNKINIGLRHHVDIYFDKKKYSYTAYVDTGNILKDPYKNRPVILINDKNLDFNYEDSILVPFKTLNNNGVIKCKKPTKIVVDYKHEVKNMLIGKAIHDFSIDDVDVLLPNKYREEYND